MSTRALVFGSRGMLGIAVKGVFARAGYDIVEFDRHNFDILKQPPAALDDVVRSGDCIINCAGIIKSTMAGHSAEAILRVNSLFPRNLGSTAKRKSARCIHITTDGVFNGERGGYSESDSFDADDLYTLSKLGGESPDCMVLRTSIVGEERGQALSLLEWARSQKGKTVQGFINHRWNGLTTVYLAEVMEKIFSKNLFAPGIFHIHSPEVVSKAELLVLMSEVYDLKLMVEKKSAPANADRSLRSIHSLSKTLVTKTIKEQLVDMKSFFAEL